MLLLPWLLLVHEQQQQGAASLHQQQLHLTRAELS
jgi:hypothetical protein